MMKDKHEFFCFFQLLIPKARQKYVQKVKVGKATGYDSIPARMVQMRDIEMCTILTDVISKCFHDNTFPDDMKKAEISLTF